MNAAQFFMRREDYQPPQTPADSPFRRFTVSWETWTMLEHYNIFLRKWQHESTASLETFVSRPTSPDTSGIFHLAGTVLLMRRIEERGYNLPEVACLRLPCLAILLFRRGQQVDKIEK